MAENTPDFNLAQGGPTVTATTRGPKQPVNQAAVSAGQEAKLKLGREFEAVFTPINLQKSGLSTQEALGQLGKSYQVFKAELSEKIKDPEALSKTAARYALLSVAIDNNLQHLNFSSKAQAQEFLTASISKIKNLADQNQGTGAECVVTGSSGEGAAGSPAKIAEITLKLATAGVFEETVSTKSYDEKSKTWKDSKRSFSITLDRDLLNDTKDIGTDGKEPKLHGFQNRDIFERTIQRNPDLKGGQDDFQILEQKRLFLGGDATSIFKNEIRIDPKTGEHIDTGSLSSQYKSTLKLMTRAGEAGVPGISASIQWSDSGAHMYHYVYDVKIVANAEGKQVVKFREGWNQSQDDLKNVDDTNNIGGKDHRNGAYGPKRKFNKQTGESEMDLKDFIGRSRSIFVSDDNIAKASAKHPDIKIDLSALKKNNIGIDPASLTQDSETPRHEIGFTIPGWMIQHGVGGVMQHKEKAAEEEKVNKDKKEKEAAEKIALNNMLEGYVNLPSVPGVGKRSFRNISSALRMDYSLV